MSKRLTSEDPISNRKRAKRSGEFSGKPHIEDTENCESESLLHQNHREGDAALKNGVTGGEGQSIGSKLRKVERRRDSRNEETLSEQIDQAKELDAVGDSTPKIPRLPKRQCALLIGFCGTECSGMQIQPNVPTIEGILFNALVKAGAVSRDNANNPTKVNLGRAARTDAGVHAAGNVVSLKMIMSVPGIPDMVSRINEELPPEIRLWGFVRVQNSFNARLSCDSRKYVYVFPSYLLLPPKPGSGLDRTLTGSTTPFSTLHADSPFWNDAGKNFSSREDDLRRKRNWRVNLDLLSLLRETAKSYEGTHNFHNFTVGREFGDRSCWRHLKRVEISDPIVHGNTEWISVMYHGQSFMLHQIRKMMCILILCCRTGTPQQIIEELYGPHVVFIPKVPSLGLLLEQPIFESYNNRISSINERLEPSHPDYRPVIDFDLYRDIIEEFKESYIFHRMRTIEDRNAVFDGWIRSIDSYAGNDLLYLNNKGTIPQAAVIKKGEMREGAFREKKYFDRLGFQNVGSKSSYQDDNEDGVATSNEGNLIDMEG